MSRNIKDVDTRIRRLCLFASTGEDEMHRLGTALLETFRDVCRYNTEAAVDTYNDLCSFDGNLLEHDSEERRMNEALIRLEFFATEESRKRYEDDIDGILRSGWMIRVMEALKMKVYSFAEYGPEFVSILNLAYMNAYEYCEQDILEALSMGRSTYYRKKRRAVILFGLAFLEFRAGLGARKLIPQEPAVGEQIRLAL